jgi:hypothetical protein
MEWIIYPIIFHFLSKYNKIQILLVFPKYKGDEYFVVKIASGANWESLRYKIYMGWERLW